MRVKDPHEIQLVFRKSKKYLRAVPKTIFDPTPAQIEARIRFGDIAKKYAGKGLSRKEITERIKEEMKGFYSNNKKTKIPEYIKRNKDLFSQLSSEADEIINKVLNKLISEHTGKRI